MSIQMFASFFFTFTPVFFTSLYDNAFEWKVWITKSRVRLSVGLRSRRGQGVGWAGYIYKGVYI